MATLENVSNERLNRIEEDARRLDRDPNFVGPIRNVVKEIEHEKQYR